MAKLPGTSIKTAARFLLAVLLLASPQARAAGAEVALESQVKTAYIFNFVRFIQWPAESFPTPESPVMIGLYGQDPISKTIKEELNGKEIEKRKIIVKDVATLEECASVHVIYIAKSMIGAAPPLLDSLKGKSILSIGDERAFIKHGGMIKFFSINKRVLFSVNMPALEKAHLSASSQMLQYATLE